MTYADILDLEDAACAAAKAWNHARIAYGQSKSKVRLAAFIAANEACEAADAALEAARDQLEADEMIAAAQAAAAIKTAEDFAQPGFAF